MYAFCWANGTIEFGRKITEGALEIARGPAKPLRKMVGATARLAYDNKTLLVPGIPEAKDQDEACTALLAYLKWLGSKPRALPAGVTVPGARR